MNAAPTRRRFLGITAAAAGLSLLPFGSRAAHAAASVVTWRGRALGAPAEMVLHHPDRAAAERLLRHAVAEVARLERVFSLNMADSALSELNRVGALAAPPPELAALLDRARAVHALSEGAFDPTVQPLWLLLARHFSTPGADPSGPPRRAVEAALDRVGLDRVAFGRDRVAFARRGMALTLNGIAQGYITDRVVALLRQGGVENTVADLGEIRALGVRDDGTPWRAGIAGVPGMTLDLVDRAVATSAASGFRFAGPGSPGHIIDPRSGATAERYESVTVLAPDATAADALSTAFGFMEPDRIAGLLPSLPGVEVLLLGHDGGLLRLG